MEIEEHIPGARVAGVTADVARFAHDRGLVIRELQLTQPRSPVVIWDMPAIPHNPAPFHARPSPAEGRRRLMTYWDDGLGAIESLHRFASALPKLLSPSPPPPKT
jgi:hypothetical protein